MYLQPALLSRTFCPETVIEIFLNKKKWKWNLRNPL